MIPKIQKANVQTVTTEEMIEVDRAMMEDYRITLPQMMENAGRSLASLTRGAFLQGCAEDRRILVMAGAGGNGGGALVGARHLANWGARVCVFLAQPSDKMSSVAGHQRSILDEMGVDLITPEDHHKRRDEFKTADVILDGLIGYSLKGAPAGPTAQLILDANKSSAPIIALDVPSGIDAHSGEIFDPAIIAKATLTLALPKTGLLATTIKKNIGTLYCADISVPTSLYEKYLGRQIPTLFSQSEIVEINLE